MLELKNKLVNLINASSLPLEAILFVVKDLYRDVQDSYNSVSDDKEDDTESEDSEE